MIKRGRNVPILAMAASLVLLGSLSSSASAQMHSAVAVGVPTMATAGVREIDRHAIAVPNEDTWRTRDLWKWIGIGFLGGAIVADGWAALEMARNNEDIMIPPIIPLAIVGAMGGAGGGLIGAIAYTAAHPNPERSPQ